MHKVVRMWHATQLGHGGGQLVFAIDGTSSKFPNCWRERERKLCLFDLRVHGDLFNETRRCLSQSYFLLMSASFHSKGTTCLHINLRHHRQRHDPRPRRLILGRMTAAISSTPSTELATVLCARPTVDLLGSRSTVGKHAKYVAQRRHLNQHYQLL